ncbi:MAG: ABC transporter ATP-binding protein [Bacteroidia bacterium]|jgi:ATP-binding cassette subfamily B protein|nr:ABC transporter ATP-binding protein [Bacteroidia bacterium]
MRELLFLNQYLIKYGKMMVWGIIFILLTNVFSASVPVLVRLGLDEALKQSLWITGKGDALASSLIFQTALAFGLGILLVAIIRGVCMYYMRQTLIVVSRQVEYDLKNRLYSKYQKLGESFYRKHMTGDLLSRTSEDVSNVRMYIGPAIMYFANMIFTFVVVIYQMAQANASLTVWVLLPLPFLSYSIYQVSRRMNLGNKQIQEQLSVLTASAQETFAGIRIIKSFGMENTFSAKFQSEGEEYKKRNMQLAKINALFFPMMLLLMGLSTLIVIYLGGKEVEKGAFTPGNLAEFVIYLNMLIWPVASLGWTTALVQKAAASQKRINEFLTAEEHQEVAGKPFVFDRDIAIQNLNFTYEGKTQPALKNLSLTIKRGEILGVTGRTGAGKSTLVQLLSAMYYSSQDAANVLIDGIPLQDINLHEFRSHLAYVPQDVFLFSETIRDNIAFGIESGEIADDELQLAVNAACLQKDIPQWPQGLNTLLGERGVSLSGGQKQRVALARALVKRADLYVLDDCLSAVDAETERQIIDHLSLWLKDATAIIVAHRIAPLKMANRIVVLEEGAIIDIGTHEELLHRCEYYRNLNDSQSAEFQ